MKKIAIIIAVTIVFASVFCVGAETVNYLKTYVSKSTIVFDYISKYFEQPIVVINNSTYVPLRESCDMLGIDLNWDSNKNTINLSYDTDKSGKFKNQEEVKKLFNMFFKIDFPESGKIIEYDFVYVNNPMFAIKVSIDEQDANVLKEYLQSENVGHSSDVQNDYEWYLKHFSETYNWWDLSEINANTYYGSVKRPRVFNIMQSTSELYLVEQADNQFVLYGLFW